MWNSVKQGGMDSRANRRNVLRITGAALSTGALGALAGCAGDKPGANDQETTTEQTTTEQTTQTVSSEDPVTVGGLVPVSGPYTPLGESLKLGIEAKVAHLNEQGGINGREVQVVFEDTQGQPESGKQAARKLVQTENADVLVGPISSAVAVLIQNFALENNVAHFTNNAENGMTMENCTETTFRWPIRNSQHAQASVPWVIENLGSNVWIHNADYNWGNEYASEFKEAFNAHGGVNIVGETKSQHGTEDYSSHLSQISASNADWVLQGLVGGDAIGFLKQAADYGLTDQKDIFAAANSLRIVRGATGQASVGTYSVAEYSESLDTEANQEFKKFLKSKFDKLPSRFVVDGWSALTGWAKAANQSSVATDDVVSTIGDMDFESPVGTASFRSCDHQATRPIMMSKIIEPGDHEWPDLSIEETVSGEDAIEPCSDVGCEF